jgi:hypothetical protein
VKVILSGLCEIPSLIELLEFVQFEWLHVDTISNLLAPDVHLFDILNLCKFICNRICRCLILRVSLSFDSSRQYSPRAISKRCESSGPLKGIVSSLMDQGQGNVHEYGLVNITSSSFNGSFPAKNAADLTGDRRFDSENEMNPWLWYEFKSGAVLPTGYSIRSQYTRAYGIDDLKNCVIEVSDSGSEWMEIDRRVNNTRFFLMDKELNGPCRFLHLQQTGRNHRWTHSLSLSGFGIFGDFFESKSSSHTK